MQRLLLIMGILLLLAALTWPWLKQLPLGRLPGDLLIEKPGFSFYFPVTTLLLTSLLVSLALFLFRR